MVVDCRLGMEKLVFIPQICPLFLYNAKSDHTDKPQIKDECPIRADELFVPSN